MLILRCCAHVRVLACMCLRMHLNENDSAKIVHSIKLEIGMHNIAYCRTGPVDFGEYWM